MSTKTAQITRKAPYLNDVCHDMARRPFAAAAMLDTNEPNQNALTTLPCNGLGCMYENCKVVAEMLEKNIANVVMSEYLFLRRSCSNFSRLTPVCALNNSNAWIACDKPLSRNKRRNTAN